MALAALNDSWGNMSDGDPWAGVDPSTFPTGGTDYPSSPGSATTYYGGSGGQTIYGPGYGAPTYGGPSSGGGGGFDLSQLFSNFPKITGGIATVISAAGGKSYSQTPQGGASSSPYGAVGAGSPYGASFGVSPAGGLFGGISTTTLILIVGAALLFMSSPGRRR